MSDCPGRAAACCMYGRGPLRRRVVARRTRGERSSHRLVCPRFPSRVVPSVFVPCYRYALELSWVRRHGAQRRFDWARARSWHSLRETCANPQLSYDAVQPAGNPGLLRTLHVCAFIWQPLDSRLPDGRDVRGRQQRGAADCKHPWFPAGPSSSDLALSRRCRTRGCTPFCGHGTGRPVFRDLLANQRSRVGKGAADVHRARRQRSWDIFIGGAYQHHATCIDAQPGRQGARGYAGHTGDLDGEQGGGIQ